MRLISTALLFILVVMPLCADEHEEIEELGKLLRLDFMLVPEEDDEEPLAVMVGTTAYGVYAEMEMEEGEFQFEVEGRLTLVEDDLLGMTFHVVLGFGGEEGNARVGANGSTAIPIGKTGTLAVLGDKTLKVKVTEIDPHENGE